MTRAERIEEAARALVPLMDNLREVDEVDDCEWSPDYVAALARVAALESVLVAADRLASYMLDVCHTDTDLGHAAAYRASRRSAALASEPGPTKEGA